MESLRPGEARNSGLPYNFRYVFSQLIATFIYWPLARTAKVMEAIGIDVSSFPLSYYRGRSFYTMRTDALDRFGTRLEKRFSKEQIFKMMGEAGLERISFSEGAPFWCAIGYRKRVDVAVAFHTVNVFCGDSRCIAGCA